MKSGTGKDYGSGHSETNWLQPDSHQKCGVVVDMYTIPKVYSVKKAYGMPGCMAKKATGETSEVILPLLSETVTLISSPRPSFGCPTDRDNDNTMTRSW